MMMMMVITPVRKNSGKIRYSMASSPIVTHYDVRSQQHVNATLPLAYCYSAL